MAANASGPGPNGNNNYGLCKAYGSGSQEGQTQKQANGAAFVALENAANAWDQADDQMVGNTEAIGEQQNTGESVQEFCAATGQHP